MKLKYFLKLFFYLYKKIMNKKNLFLEVTLVMDFVKANKILKKINTLNKL